MNIRKSILLLSLLSWLPLVGSTGCDDGEGSDGDDPTAYCDLCNLDEQIPLLTAEGTTDCGMVGVGEDPMAVVSCIEQALADGTPFTARQQLQGIDSTVSIGYVGDEDGVVQRLSHDSNICGGAGCDEHCGPRVSAAECGNPRAGAMPMDSILDCDLGEFTALCGPVQ